MLNTYLFLQCRKRSVPEANSIHVLRFFTWSTYAVTSSLSHLIGYLTNSSSLLVADVFSQHLVNLARNSFRVTRKRVNIFTPPYVTSSCYPRIRDPDEFCTHSVSHSSSPVLTPFPEMLLRRLPLPCLFFFYVGTKCCFDHADLIMLQHKRLIYLTTIWIKLAGRGPLHFRQTLNSNFLLSQIWIKLPRHLFKDSR